MTDAYEMPTEEDEPLLPCSVRLTASLRDQATALGDEIERPFSWVVRNALACYLVTREPPLVDEWRATDQSGSSGATYEVSLGFELPATSESDELAYLLRDRLVMALTEFGARHSSTRMIKLGALPRDPRCEAAACEHD